MPATAALDIETSGLSPESDSILGVAVATGTETESCLATDEVSILEWLETRISRMPRNAVLITWNGEEFDLPFLARRFEEHHIATSLRVHRKIGRGKYGGALYDASWGEREHIDIAPIFKNVAERESVQWSLKPVSRAVLHALPVEVDRSGEAIARLTSEQLQAYVESDAKLTLKLAEWAVAHLHLDLADASTNGRESLATN